jgi:hypothetical protein
MGFNNLANFLKNSKDYVFAFHGTFSIENALNICCQSWDSTMRHVQSEGAGEYFTTYLNTAASFGACGGIIITLIIYKKNTENICMMPRSKNENWYIVNNKKDISYCLPIGILHNDNKLVYHQCPRKGEIIQKILNQKFSNIYYENSFGWQEYGDENVKKILLNIKEGKILFKANIDSKIVIIDLIHFLEINIKNGFTKKIKFEYDDNT